MNKSMLLYIFSITTISSFAETKITCTEIENIFKTDSYITRYNTINSFKSISPVSNWTDDDFKQFSKVILDCKKEGYLKRYGDITFSQYITDALSEIKAYRDQEISSKASDIKALELLTAIEVKVDSLRDAEISKIRKELTGIETELKNLPLTVPTNEITKKEELIEEKIQNLKNKLFENEINEQQLAMEKETKSIIDKFKTESIEQAKKNRANNPQDYKKCINIESKLSPLDKKLKELIKQIIASASQKMKLKLSKEYENTSYKADKLRPEFNNLECPKYFHD